MPKKKQVVIDNRKHDISLKVRFLPAVSLEILDDSSGKKWSGHTWYGHNNLDVLQKMRASLTMDGYDPTTLRVFVKDEKKIELT